MAQGRLQKKRKLGFEHLILTLALLVGLPGGLLGLVLLWTGSFEPKTKWTLTLFLGFSWWLLSIGLQNRVIRPIQTLANIVEGLREGDFSLRARGARPFDALGELILDVNILAEQLRGRRLDSLEATALLQKVMSEIDVAIFAFDSNQQLRLVNRAGEQLLGRPAASLVGGRRSGTAEYLEPLRALLFHQTGWIGNRFGSQPSDRRGARWKSDVGKPEIGTGLHRPVAASTLSMFQGLQARQRANK